MITIQELLFNRGLDKNAKIKLVRHKDGRQDLYNLYKTEKHKFLANKHDELTAFRISKDGMREKIVMMSEDDTVLEINNPLIIDEVLNLCENKLSDLLKESENQILAFEI